MTKKRMNWRNVSSDLKEAREQLEEIEKRIQKRDLAEVELQLLLEHAYRHLNFAWNTRKVTTKNYANLTEAEFNKWSQFPKEIQIYTIPKKAKRKTHNKRINTDRG